MKTAGIFTPEMDEDFGPIWNLPSGSRVAAERANLDQRPPRSSTMEYAFAEFVVGATQGG